MHCLRNNQVLKGTIKVPALRKLTKEIKRFKWSDLEPENNKSNGQIKRLVLKTALGRIILRSVLCLLWSKLKHYPLCAFMIWFLRVLSTLIHVLIQGTFCFSPNFSTTSRIVLSSRKTDLSFHKPQNFFIICKSLFIRTCGSVLKKNSDKILQPKWKQAFVKNILENHLNHKIWITLQQNELTNAIRNMEIS